MRWTLLLLLSLNATFVHVVHYAKAAELEVDEVGSGLPLRSPEARSTDGRSSEESIHTERLGYLRQNQKQRENPAPFVLTDRMGTVRYYVTAKGQADLEPFINHHVAIRGDAFQRSHRFAVDEVIPLDTKDIPPLKKSAESPGKSPRVRSTQSDTNREPVAGNSGKVRDNSAKSNVVHDSQVAAARFDRPMKAASNGSLVRKKTSPGLRNAVTQMKRPRTLPTGHQEEIATPIGEPILIGPSSEMPIEGSILGEEFEGTIIDGDPDSLMGMSAGLGECGDDLEFGPCCGLGWWHGDHGPCGTSGRCWIHAEYLLWSIQGMRTPPLVTQSPAGTARADAGVLGTNGVQVLFGGRHLDRDPHSGVRVRAGFWFFRLPNVGMEGEYLGLSEENSNFQTSSTGNPIIGRPFFDAFNGRETAELVAFPAVLSGTVTVDAITDLQSAGARLIFAGGCDTNVCGDECDPCARHPRTRRIDWLLGYRYLQLDDTLSVREDLVSQDPANPGSFLLRDSFDTRNQFNGGEFGLMCGIRRCCWSIDLLSKLAIGNNHQQVTINGSTAITQAGVTTNHVGGLLAQRTNIGVYDRDQLSVVPELGLTLGCQITPRLRGTIGYTFIYWSNVVRPGDQIDRDINPNLLPVENPIQTTHLRPEFVFRETDIWIQGLNAGLELRW